MGEPDIATAAALFGDPARAAMLLALLDSRSLSAGELALAANVSPQSASFHLSKLTQGRLVACVRRGRNQVYRLSGPAVARALEALTALAPRAAAKPQLRAARSCYDHLAGVAGVLLHDSILRLGYLNSDYSLSGTGRSWFLAGGGADELLLSRSPFARPCVDWTERRPHLAGRLAAFLLDRFLQQGWMARTGNTRALRVTDRGLRGFEREYGLNLRGGENGYALHTIHDRSLQGRRL